MLKGEGFPLPTKPLQPRPSHAITSDARRNDRLPRQLRRGLVDEGRAKLGGDGGAQGLQCPAIVVVVDAADVNRLPLPPSLQLDLHQQAPLVVVRRGEHRPRRSCSGVMVDRLQHRGAAAPTTTLLW